MINLMVLHWGTINQTIRISGIDPSSGNITADIASDVLRPVTVNGRIRALKGRGKSKGVTGRGGNG